MKKTKLELTWPGKDERPRLEPRILLEHPERGHHAAARREGDLFDNMLIKGDNLLTLKALEQDYAGKVKCVFIDPPYNTGSAFEQYDDGLEHSLWLSLMRDRVSLIHRLLRDDGSLWVTLDDNEAHYFKVMCDQIFGRANFVATVVWEKDKGGRGDADISLSHDNIIVYAKDRKFWSKSRNLLPRTETQLGRFKNPDNDPRGPWRQGDDGTAKSGTEKQRFPIVLPSGRSVTPPPGRYWAFSQTTLELARAEGRAYFGQDGDRLPIIKRYITEVRDGVAPRTWWSADEVGTNQQAKRDHLNKLLAEVEPFATPKPEGLLQRILTIATNPGDLVLDSFAGSGTTGAVAHKMGRRWIMVEIGNHADTHIVPRLTKVIDGDDAGGVTKAVGWEGGGGFRYYTLAPSLLERDAYDNWVIAPEYNGPMLAQAMCKHLGFTYDPAQGDDGDERHAEWWRHGRSSERDFLYVTTQALTQDALRLLSEDVGPERSLLICARAFSGNIDAFENLTCRKIPASILSKCEWGRDDYSLNIAALPEREAANDAPDAGPLFAREPANG
ncbi:site-specific DNA-methyltransferase [uncultured Sphingomonas sp.]|uniref:site-specific DNA-methyltransferase n=1 Tax=uncultured Sphingomonas sp. TaxID=158754 RepID=UPI0025ED4BCB|nr:site-specific DNA-methyltransferase [uncultured Sphingomonas sp.]